MKSKINILFWIVMLFGNFIIGSTTSWCIFSKIAIASNIYIVVVLHINLYCEKSRKRIKRQARRKLKSSKISQYQPNHKLRAI
ncbi:MAG: hypothetical protein IJC83_02500 [Oscillospiraceae bacterium]|nr:hypothetical protein [Oscillospiraceae bacterium]